MPFAPHDEVSLYYEQFGDPADPTLLLINGLGSQCINYRVEWCEKFVAAGFHVIRFDNRDVGLSTKLEPASADEAGYTVADMVGDALAVLDAAGIERAHVMGFSMGGMIVQQMAIDHPGRMITMTSVMSTTGDRDVGNPTAEALGILMGPPATDREGSVAKYLAGIRAYGSPACYDEARLVPLAEEAYDRCFYPEGVARQLQAVINGGSRTSGLGSVRMPALVLHGDEDRLVDISGGRRTAEAIPGARFVALEGMGHDYPPQYWDRIVSLVASHAGVEAPAA